MGEELKNLLKSVIVTPDSSVWSFTVGRATNNDRKQRFFVDYQMINQKLKADTWPIPKQKDVLDELSVSGVFSNMNFF